MKKARLLNTAGRLLPLLIFLSLFNYSFGQQTITSWMNTAQQRIDTLRKGHFTIKAFDKDGNEINDSISINLKQHEFVFGCANDFSSSNNSSDPTIPSVNDWIKANMLKYFNFNVTGNAFKWSGTQPYSATSYNYGPVDSVVNWGTRENFNLKGHTMIWGAYNDSDYHSIPKWVMDLPTNQAIYDACKTRVQSMALRYKGKFKEYDILNEPLHATWLKTKLGSDSIYWNLFKWAREIDTVTKFYINDYNVEYNWGDAVPYKALIKKMLSKGAPIDGIGVQAHFWFSSGVDLAELKQNMDTLATIGLPMRFTEFDLDSMSQPNQAFHTSNLFRFAFSHPAFNGVISWGFWDAGAWRTNSGYFDVNKQPKIAADTIYKLIHKVWTTNINSKLVGATADFKGYYGKYEVKVKFGNSWKLFIVDCDKLHKDSTFILNEQNSVAVRPQFISAKLLSRNHILVKFDKKMINPSGSIRAFKVFQIAPFKIDSISLLPQDSTVISIKLASPVSLTTPATIAYNDGNMVSTDGGVLDAFGPEKIDGNFVTYTSANTSKDGKSVELKFNKPMNDPSAQLAAFSIFAGSTAITLDSVRLKSGNDSIMVFSFSKTLTPTDVVTIYYTAGNVASQSGLVLESFSKVAVTNYVIKLAIVSAATSKDGKTVEAVFNYPMNDPSAQKYSFTLVNSYSILLDSVRLKTGNDSVYVFYLSKAAKTGYVLSLSYTAGSVTAKNGQKLATFLKYSVTNNVVTAVPEISAENEAVIFPNPATDNIYLKSSGCFSQVIITNLNGQVVLRKDIKDQSAPVDISSLNEGTYIVTAIRCQGGVLKSKLVKKK